MTTKKTPAEMLQPAAKFTDFAATPQEFLRKLESGEIKIKVKKEK